MMFCWLRWDNSLLTTHVLRKLLIGKTGLDWNVENESVRGPHFTLTQCPIIQPRLLHAKENCSLSSHNHSYSNNCTRISLWNVTCFIFLTLVEKIRQHITNMEVFLPEKTTSCNVAAILFFLPTARCGASNVNIFMSSYYVSEAKIEQNKSIWFNTVKYTNKKKCLGWTKTLLQGVFRDGKTTEKKSSLKNEIQSCDWINQGIISS